MGATIVIDIGKTLSKISMWSADGRMIDRRTRTNEAVVIDGARRLDARGIAEWLFESLPAYAGHPVERIVPVGHGAGVVALVDDQLAFPPSITSSRSHLTSPGIIGRSAMPLQ